MLNELKNILDKARLFDEIFRLYQHLVISLEILPFNLNIKTSDEDKKLYEQILMDAALAAYSVEELVLAKDLKIVRDRIRRSRVLR